MNEGVPDMMMFACIYCNRRYFVASIGYLEEGQTISRHRWCQVITDVNADAQMMYLYTP